MHNEHLSCKSNVASDQYEMHAVIKRSQLTVPRNHFQNIFQNRNNKYLNEIGKAIQLDTFEIAIPPRRALRINRIAISSRRAKDDKEIV